jgi:hypothetical protein
MQFTGLKDFLESKKPNEQVKKSDIQDFMRDNRIEVVEVVKLDRPFREIKKHLKMLETNGKKCMGVFTQNYLINQTSMKGDTI